MLIRRRHDTFSAEAGTFFETVRSERSAVLKVLALLSERNSLRAIERLTHHPHQANLHWLIWPGSMWLRSVRI
jgi:hypothetical protein